MFIRGTPSSAPARQALRSVQSRQKRFSVPSPSGQRDAADQHANSTHALRSCEDAYLEFCRRNNVSSDNFICGPHQQEIRLRNVLPPKRATLLCTRCGSNHTKHVTFAAKDDPSSKYTKCMDCSAAANEQGESIGPFSIYEEEPRDEFRAWFPFTNSEKAALNEKKRVSRSQAATPGRPSSPATRRTSGVPTVANDSRSGRSTASTSSSSAPSTPTPARAPVRPRKNDAAGSRAALLPEEPLAARVAGTAATSASIEEIRNKPINDMTDDEVFEWVTDYLQRGGYTLHNAASPASSIASPSAGQVSEPASLSSPSPARSNGKQRAAAPDCGTRPEPPRRPDSCHRPSSSGAHSKRAATNSNAPRGPPLSSSTQITRVARRQVNVHVELLNRAYYRFVATLCNGRLVWDEFRGQSTLRLLFMFPQYGLEVFDSWVQHWRQMGLNTAIRVLPDQTTVFARIVYARALTLEDPIVISSDSEPELLTAQPTRAGNVSDFFSDSDDGARRADAPASGTAKKRRKNAGSGASGKRRKVSHT